MSAALSLLALGVASLVPGAPAQATLAAGQTRTLRLDVPAGHVVRGTVDQGEHDLVVRITAPDGATITCDARSRAAEPIAFAAAAGGVYQVAITTAGRETRRVPYAVRLDPPRAATADDERWIEATALATSAKQLAARGGRDGLQNAVATLTTARAIWRALQAREPELHALVSESEALYALSDYSGAAARAREAIAIADELGDRWMGAEARNTLGLASWRVGEVIDALDLLQQAIDTWRAEGAGASEAAALSNRGLLLQETGQFDQARQHFAQALARVRARGDRRGEAFTLNNMGAVLDHLGQRQEGLAHVRRAVTLFRAAGDGLAEGRALLLQSRIELELGRQSVARPHAERALALIRQAENRAAEADALRLLGRITAATPEAASAHYEQALALYRTTGSRRGEADVLHAIGVLSLAAGEHARAIASLDRAREIRRAIGIARLEAETLAQMAAAERGRGDLDRARALLEDALALVETLRAGLFERELRSSYLDATHDYDLRYLDVLVALHRERPLEGFGALAFEAAERHRARELIESLRLRWAASVPPAQAALAADARNLRGRLNHTSWQLWQLAGRPESAAREAELRRTIADLLARHRDLDARIARAMPEYSALLQPESVPLPAIQAALGDAVLLQYTLGEARSYVIAVTSRDVTIGELPRRSEIETRARAWHGSLARTVDPAQRARRAQDARALGRMLLGPVAAQLTRRLTIVADGALQFVPFAALIHDDEPLVSSHDLVIAPSAAAVMLLQRTAAERRPAPRTLAIFADPVFDAGDVRVRARAVPHAPAAALPLTRRLTRLPFSRDEAEQIARTAPNAATHLALDFAASREWATSAGLGAFRIVHFATHAIQDSDHPELSGIVLSLVDAAGAPQDGFLRLHDVYTLRLNADLVVLSACETALPRGRQGVASLAAGFFAAGVPRVVSTLWKVDDEATAALMSAFYRALLGEGRDPAAALAEAQRTLSRDRRFGDPAYWAPFVLQGVR
jgi:CHAT domain-containing protein/tetratricopeptide (TPR) repeat protein